MDFWYEQMRSRREYEIRGEVNDKEDSVDDDDEFYVCCFSY